MYVSNPAKFKGAIHRLKTKQVLKDIVLHLFRYVYITIVKR